MEISTKLKLWPDTEVNHVLISNARAEERCHDQISPAEHSIVCYVNIPSAFQSFWGIGLEDQEWWGQKTEPGHYCIQKLGFTNHYANLIKLYGGIRRSWYCWIIFCIQFCASLIVIFHMFDFFFFFFTLIILKIKKK